MSTPLETLAVTLGSYAEELDRLAEAVRPIWLANGRQLTAALAQVAVTHFDPRMREVAGQALERADWRWVAEAFETVLADQG